MQENNIKKDILEATDGGRQIFIDLFSGTSKYFDTKKLFKSPFRDDRTPSAGYWHNGSEWKLKDFGVEIYSSFDAWMKVNNCNDFSQALKQLAAEYDVVTDNGYRQPLNAEYRERQVLPEQPEGKSLEYNEGFTQAQLKFLSPLATPEVCKSLGIRSVKRIIIVKDGKEMSYYERPNYPIYAREARMIDMEGNITKTVTKIYQPHYKAMNGKPNRKFSYLEKDMQPGDIVNGLYELKQAKDRGEDNIKACICCGERDAVCVKGAGYHPIWFNSESHLITEHDMMLIKKYADKIYYIPDIDEPGTEKAMQNIRNFPDLNIVLLPQDMKNHQGDQHKPAKDLRDWMAKHPKKGDFRKLVNRSRNYKLVKWNDGKAKVSADNLRFFLELNGYFKCKDELFDETMFVKIEGKRVSKVEESDIRDFVIDHMDEAAYTPYERDLVMASAILSKNITDVVPVNLDFTCATEHSQLVFCRNQTFAVTANGIFEVDEKEHGYVWDSKVIAHDVTLTDDIITWTKEDNPMGENTPYYRMELKRPECKLAEFQKNVSCIHYDVIERGETLTEQQQYENNQNFAVHFYNLGNALHRYHSPAKALAPYYFENDRYEGVEANGGTGKSMLYRWLLPGLGYHVVRIDGKSPKVFTEQFLYQEVTSQTDVITFDEVHKEFKLSIINNDITAGVQVERKQKQKKTAKTSQMKKFIVLSNYDPVSLDPSDTRRASFAPMSHFYHAKSDECGFKENRTVESYFGMNLWDDNYPEADWILDINYCMLALKFYLEVNARNERLEAPMAMVRERLDEKNTSPTFNVWADGYFNEVNLNSFIKRDEALESYNLMRRGQQLKPVTRTRFTQDLKKWAEKRDDLEYNPTDLCKDKKQRRIMHDKTPFIYIRTIDLASSNADQEIPF